MMLVIASYYSYINTYFFLMSFSNCKSSFKTQIKCYTKTAINLTHNAHKLIIGNYPNYRRLNNIISIIALTFLYCSLFVYKCLYYLPKNTNVLRYILFKYISALNVCTFGVYLYLLN